MWRTWGAAAAIVLLGLAGCSNTSGQPDALPGLSSTPAATAATTAATPPTDGAALALRLTVAPQQVGAGWTSEPIPGGDQVQGQVTLDLCGARFTSESMRIARHQVVLMPPGAGSSSADSISNEVVIYGSGGARQARSDLMQAITSCPTGPVQGTVAGEGVQTYKISTLPSDTHWLPGTVAIRAVVTNSTGRRVDMVAIYQFRGDALSAVYGSANSGRADASELRAAAQAATLLSSSAPAAP
jgi:hypothetical protein